MSLNQLIKALSAMPDEAAIVFRTDDYAVGAGFHVTELKLANMSSIDCGANQSSWTEAALQLLDGSTGPRMQNAKLLGILRQSVRNLAGLGTAPLSVEFAPRNEGLQTFTLSEPALQGSEIVIAMLPKSAVCKPATAFAIAPSQESCCSTEASRCC